MKAKGLSFTLSLVALLWLPWGAHGQSAPPNPLSKLKKSRLVISVVYDQLGSWVLERNFGFLDPKGALRQTFDQGVYYHRALLDYSYTATAAGHTAAYTGKTPREAGVSTNEMWDASARKLRSVAYDPRYPLFDDPALGASPKMLSASTVADVLKSTYPTAKVVSLSIKDRGAIFPAGKHPDMVLWYSDKAGALTSSTYYMKALPEWFTTWRNAHPISNYFSTWEALDAARWELVFGRDAGAGEPSIQEINATFPHDLSKSSKPNFHFMFFPGSVQYLLDAAKVCSEHYALGRDNVPDLLEISISGTDVIGHAFGPNSWESLDFLVRADAMLGQFLEPYLKRDDVTVLITADHGAPPITEFSLAHGVVAGRVKSGDVVRAASAAAIKLLGAGEWIDVWTSDMLVFSKAARESKSYDQLVDAVVEAVKRVAGVHSAYGIQALRKKKTFKDDLERLVRNSTSEHLDGDVWIVLKPYFQADLTDRGDTVGHGRPWFYDREVPVLVRGPGVVPFETKEPWIHSNIAATLARALGVQWGDKRAR